MCLVLGLSSHKQAPPEAFCVRSLAMLTSRRQPVKPFRPLHRVLLMALIACASLALPTIADAQALYGSITGSVTDNTGASIPGVTVTVTNEGTGLKLETVTV